MKNLLLSLSFLLFIAKTNAQTGNLFVVLANGTMLSYALNETQKLDFSGDQLNIHQTNGTVDSWSFSAINYYTYQQPVGIDVIKNQHVAGIELFPNPSDGLLKLKYLFTSSESLTIKIYNISGILVKEEKIKMSAQEIHTFDVSKLSNGQYICKIEGSTFKVSRTFIKN